MSGVKQAMVLAAGLGTRMRPITETIPKPLVPVAGRTMLDHALDALEMGGVERVAVNAHYLADQIDAHVLTRTTPAIAVSDERAELLDSGGGVKAALPLLDDGALFILNSDSFWEDANGSTLRAMADAWRPEDMDMLLLLASHEAAVGFAGAGDFFLEEKGRLARRGDADRAPWVYAGAILTKPSLFKAIEERVFSLNRLFDEAITAGRLHGHVLDGLWLHVGTPAAIGEAETAIAAFGATRDG